MILSRSRLADFASCRRRFQLNWWQPFTWPLPPQTDQQAISQNRGKQFHLLLERHFLELSVPAEALADDELLAGWWRTFQEKGPKMPAGQHLSELALTVPLGNHFLIGRFDLVLLTGSGVHIYDWKTGRPWTAIQLEADWQTRLYLALIVQGWHGLQPKAPPLDPAQVSLTYWYVTAPTASVTMRYSAAQHQANWEWLEQLATALDEQIVSDDSIWPLTADWGNCARCRYQVYCGRQPATPAATAAEEEVVPELFEAEPRLEAELEWLL